MFSSCRVYGASSQIQHDLGCFKYYYWVYIYIYIYLSKGMVSSVIFERGTTLFCFCFGEGPQFYWEIWRAGRGIYISLWHLYFIIFIFEQRSCLLFACVWCHGPYFYLGRSASKQLEKFVISFVWLMSNKPTMCKHWGFFWVLCYALN